MTGKMRNVIIAAGLLGVFFVSLSVAREAESGVHGTRSVTITVAAASDLQFAFSEMAELFQKETGNKVALMFGSTGMLAQQIENGAPIDVFAAANTEFVDDLRQKDMIIADSQQTYSIGRIALVGSKSARVVVKDLDDLLNPDVKRIAIANPEHAPYGAAAKQALQAAGVWDRVSSKIVYGENVRQVLQYVQTGNVEAGIIALSIAYGMEPDYVIIDASLHRPLIQSIAVVEDSKEVQVSREFISFINSSSGRSIMKKYGFLLPGEF